MLGTRARRLSRTDSQAGGDFTCPVRMRAFCPFLLSSYHYVTFLYVLLTAVYLSLYELGSSGRSSASGMSKAKTSRQEIGTSPG